MTAQVELSTWHDEVDEAVMRGLHKEGWYGLFQDFSHMHRSSS